jgi:hypothetical protein
VRTSDLQRRLATALGVDVSSDDFHTAAARLYEIIWPALEIHDSQIAESEKQAALAKDIGLDIHGDNRAGASQRIAARLRLLNEIALHTLDLRPGDLVVLRAAPEEVHSVSCVGRNRKIYLKGWRGESVWATQVLKKVTREAAREPIG